MKNITNTTAISLAFRFYARALIYPYDELTHEFQYLFREMEKNIRDEVDNTIAAKALDVLNSYQGEEMSALQAEFTRMFSPEPGAEPFIPLHLADIAPEIDVVALNDILIESPLYMQLEDHPDSIPQVLDYFSSLLMEEPEAAESFFTRFLKPALPKLNERIYKGSSLNFYREMARGLNELVYLLAQDATS